MDFDQIDFSDLPANREMAFINLERQLKQAYEVSCENDRQSHRGQDGIYTGEYEPERNYVSAILAFLDELRLDIGAQDISAYSWDDGQEFMQSFSAFRQKVYYAVTRFKLRMVRTESGAAGTLLDIRSEYKVEISKLLTTIRKIVNQEISDENKKDRIHRKIAALQLEIDRERSTIDTLFSAALDFTRTIAECAENLTPLLDKAEQVKKLIWDNTRLPPSLPARHEVGLIEDRSDDSDDEIPH